ncbi:MAG: 3-hydroxyacyl-CoA dehydrogenase NAD-binding domain-containing protein [Saprospiraceae bacterium]
MIEKIGIVGSGAMGIGIAQVAATAGQAVVLFDASSSALENAKHALLANLKKLEAKGKLESAEVVFSNVIFADSLHEFSTSQFVIEAVVEDISVKKHLFQSLEEVVAKDCILATNTSSLSITSIAASCNHASRVIGVHFFNPAPIMELVEIIPALQTDAVIVDVTKSLVDFWKKSAVLCKDTPGFIVNRIARPYYGEALRILDEGIASCETIDAAMRNAGFRMGPFELMDFIGHDVNFRVSESVFQSFYFDPRFKPSFTQKRLFEAGWYGRKSGKGFYDYAESVEKKAPDSDNLLQNKVFLRILSMLINEAADALHFGVASEEDIETAMKKGVNYPKGLFEWAAEIGVEQIVKQLDSLYVVYGEDRYRCSPTLRKRLG